MSEVALDNIVTEVFAASLADSTKRTYSSQLRSYLFFCQTYGYIPFPASMDTILRYVAYLYPRLSYSSIKQYISVVRVMHEDDFPSSKTISYMMRGIKRLKGDVSCQKLPITVDILGRIRDHCNLNDPEDAAFWGACLVMFYGMLRKSSVFPPKGNILRIGDASLIRSGLVLRMRYSKTVQFQQRETFVVLPYNSNTELCPVRALLEVWLLSGVKDTSSPLLPVMKQGRIAPLSSSRFSKRLSHHLSKLHLSGYSGHSFRRGGASHALAKGVPSEVIMAQGDWKSNCYLRYLNLDKVSARSVHIRKMTRL